MPGHIEEQGNENMSFDCHMDSFLLLFFLFSKHMLAFIFNSGIFFTLVLLIFLPDEENLSKLICYICIFL